MIKKLRIFWKNEGYSIIEIFFLLFFISIVSTIIYTHISSISNAIYKSKNKLDMNYDLIRLRLLLTKECQRISPPYFLKNHKSMVDKDILNIYFYNGIKNECLTLTTSNNELNIYVNNKIIFKSKNIKGIFIFEGNYILYQDNDYEFLFSFGVFFV